MNTRMAGFWGETGTLTLFAALIGYLAIGPAPATAQTGTVSGTVTDQISGAPLGGVRVFAVGRRGSTITDADGIYSFSTAPGDIVVRAALPRAREWERAVTVSSGGGATVDIGFGVPSDRAVRPGRRGLRYEIVLPRGPRAPELNIFPYVEIPLFEGRFCDTRGGRQLSIQALSMIRQNEAAVFEQLQGAAPFSSAGASDAGLAPPLGLTADVLAGVRWELFPLPDCWFCPDCTIRCGTECMPSPLIRR